MEYFPLKISREADFKAKYKTELCRSWIQGICEFGDKCTFAHGSSELRNKEHLTVNYRTKKCKQFHEQGFCQYGSRCQFKHREFSPDTASSSPREKEMTHHETKKRLPIFIKLSEEAIFNLS